MNSLAEPRKWEKLLWPLVALGMFLALWHYSVVWTATKVFPAPLTVLKGVGELARKGVPQRFDYADEPDKVREDALIRSLLHGSTNSATLPT